MKDALFSTMVVTLANMDQLVAFAREHKASTIMRRLIKQRRVVRAWVRRTNKERK